MSILQPGPRDRLKILRHGIEHLDERILSLHPEALEPIALFPFSDRVEFQSQTLRYAELADWLAQMHRLAELIISYRGAAEPGPGPHELA